jgi:predicted nucleotidyltransferase
MLRDTIRSEIRARLEAIFAGRLREVILFGSEARNEAQADSDIDILVVLEEPIRFGHDLDQITRALYPFQLQIPERPLQAIPASEQHYRSGEYALYRQARSEGIPL